MASKIPHKVTFTGTCHRFTIRPRGPNDNHICILMEVGDDGNWFVSDRGDFSSFWLPEVIKLLEDVREFILTYCEPEPNGYGWRFPDEA